MNMNKAVQVTYFLLRVVTGLLFFQVGAMKMFGWFGGMPGGGTPPLMSQIGIGAPLRGETQFGHVVLASGASMS
jgi:uncharacterized membrane protein YphA (DoxX/SURF4 family)